MTKILFVDGISGELTAKRDVGREQLVYVFLVEVCEQYVSLCKHDARTHPKYTPGSSIPAQNSADSYFFR